MRKKLELDAEITARWSNDISIKKHVILCNIDYFKEEMLMKLTSDEFNELQRWIEVRDSCQEAKAKLRQAANYANSHNYDKKKYIDALNFASQLEDKAISKIKDFVKK